jgi:predicted amidophosphoribosyltransferase
MCGGVLPCLKRTKPTTKSATAGVGQRQSPGVHYESIEVDHQRIITAPTSITIVDDVITRGSTFLAMYQRLAKAFPQAEIRCFAVVRTMSDVQVDQIMSPVEGVTTFTGMHRLRQP